MGAISASSVQRAFCKQQVTSLMWIGSEKKRVDCPEQTEDNFYPFAA